MKLVEGIIATINPRWACSRAEWRARYAAYAAADPKAKTPYPWKPVTGTSDQVLNPSLDWLRARSRDGLRNHPAIGGAVEGRVANVVGTGIGIEPDSGDVTLDEILDDGYDQWADQGGHDGRSLWEMQQVAHREWIVAGALLWRWVALPERADVGRLPDALMAYEVEWLATEPIRPTPKGLRFVRGIEIDSMGRPVWYHLRDPSSAVSLVGAPSALGAGLTSTTTGEVVAASEIIHGFRKVRPSQHHGEPELSASLLWFWNGHTLVEAELRAAVVGAAPSVLVKTRDGGSKLGLGALAAANAGASQDPTRPNSSLPALGPMMPTGGVAALFPDEDVSVVENKRPSQGIFPFLKAMHGLVAGALRIGRRWIDRDVGDASYSSQRADQQDTRKLLEPEQHVFGQFVAGAVYRRIAPLVAAVAGRPMSRDPIRRERQLRAHLQPDGWPYVNPHEDVQAMAMRVGAGFSTHTEEIAARGGSRRKIWRQLAREQAEARELGITVDLSGTNAPAPASTVGQQPDQSQPQGSQP